MTFDEILDGAIELLRRRGRISCRALKRQFELDDEYLDDLTFELIHGQRVAREEDGAVLVWSGGDGAAEPPVRAPAPRQDGGPAAPESAAISPANAEPAAVDETAERRQLTVMFCDLVGSTSLSARLDPEDLREIIQEYQQVCDAVVRRFDGHVSQHLGDGIVVYFGYPRAHEDDARRAVRAGLAFFEAMQELNARLQARTDVRLAVRVGVHTGVVVVGEVGGSSHRESLALGETPNVAARIQSFAEPDTLIVSQATLQLVEGFFDVEPLGARRLPGVGQPIPLYRVIGDRERESRLDVAAKRGLSPFIGREAETDLVMERWEQVVEGHGQAILISGEAGIGKSRLVRLLQERIRGEGAECRKYRCSTFFENSALRPVIEALRDELGFERDDTSESRLDRLEDLVGRRPGISELGVSVLAPLLSVPLLGRHEEPGLSPERHKELTLEYLAELILGGTDGPALVVWEDLQWADPSTLELLELVIEQVPARPVLLLATHRPEFRPPWPTRSHLVQLFLNRLTRSQVEALIESLAGGKRMPRPIVEAVVEKTDGNPLFVEEITKWILESDLVVEADGAYRLRRPGISIVVPSTLHDSLMARLDRLGDAKEIAQVGATIGREFSRELVEAVSALDDAALGERLERLVDSELVHRRGIALQAIYVFKHALVQETAYRSLLKKRRREFHRRIVEVLEERFPEIVDTQPEMLAHHCEGAGLLERAIPYWHEAGEQAVARSAHPEALSHLNRGLDLLEQLPASEERVHQEILFQIALGVPLTALRGYGSPEVEQAYGRARELCQRAGETSQLVPALYGLWRYYLLRAEYDEARALSDQLLALAQAGGDPEHLVVAHRASGSTSFYVGDLEAARGHLEQILSSEASPEGRAETLLYDVVDAWVTARSYTSWTLWLLGAPDEALRHSMEALELARGLGHPFSVALAHCFAAWLHQFRGEPEPALRQAQEGMSTAEENGFAFWVGWARVMAGWARAQENHPDALRHMEEGLSAWHATGSQLGRSYFLGLMAATRLEGGALDAARRSLDDAERFTRDTGEGFWSPELLRLRGELTLAESPSETGEAEESFRRALALAARQGSRALELRAATSLAALLRRRGRGDEARSVLGPVHAGFKEGLDLPDLQKASRLLVELR